MKTIGSLVSIALLGFSSAAFGAEIWTHGSGTTGQLRWDGFDSGSTAVNVTSSGPSYNGSGGQFKGYFGDTPLGGDEFFRFFCIDLSQYATTGPLEYLVSTHSSNALARLFDIAYPNKTVGDFYNGGATSFGQFSSGVYSSAFQLALWEIYFETSAGSFDLTNGTFKSNTGADSSGTDAQKAVAQAGTWLGQINGGAGSATGWTLYTFTNERQQDYLSAVYRERQGGGEVPEPGTLALIGLGIAFGAMRRRRA